MATSQPLIRSRFFSCALPALALALSGCAAPAGPRPAVAWDARAEALIAEADHCCGLLHNPNGIPAARLWGDGRLVWVQLDASGRRRVLEAHLSPAEMTDLLQAFVDQGFFEWKDSYQPQGQVYDAPSTCLRLTLAGADKSVCEALAGAPEAFHDLYARVTGGAGRAGLDYVPARGFLTAYLQQDDGGPSPPPDLVWPAESLGLSLENAVGGVWVTGETLALAWRVVNARQWGALVQDGDSYYQIVLWVPGLTRTEPPHE